MTAADPLRATIARHLPPEQIDGVGDGVERYLALLEHWNRTHNLTGFRAREDLVRLGVGDSLVPLGLLPPEAPAVDVGSGAGFPAIPLALAEPERPWTLLEPRRKRASFLKEVCLQLQLDNVSVRRERLEEEGPPVPLFTSRAVGGLAAIVRNRLGPGGLWIVATTTASLHANTDETLTLDSHTAPARGDARCWARYRRA